MTLHPEGKEGVSIDREKYESMKGAILSVLEREGQMTFVDLMKRVEEELNGNFDGSIAWYYTTVKLDLEARKLLRRVEGSKPQLVELV